MAHLLLVEDRAGLARMLERALAGEGHEVELATDGETAVERVAEGAWDLVLTDLKLPGASGLDVVAACRARRPSVPVVVMTGYGTVSTAVEAMKNGALDFLEKPVDLETLFALVDSVVAPAEGGEPVFEVEGAPPIVGADPRLRAALHLLERVAPTESTVLLTGESGTGKELFARALHALSERGQGPFVAVNCAAIPETLVENELFGHEKGAFTGAGRRQAGRFELAAGGTLLLDEVGELGLEVQAKVLRVLEERTFERVGGGATLHADVRLVAATNRSLAGMVEEGRLRGDLFYRLDVFPIELPPLRERPADVGPLCRHLIARIAERHGRPTPVLEEGVTAALAARPWPGNVRQLANVLERAVILADGDRLSAVDLEALIEPFDAAGERERVRRALTEADGDKRAAAESLGWGYRKLLRKVKEHDLEGVPKYRSG